MTKLPLRRLVELVCSQAGDWPAAQECCAALRSTSAEALRGSLVPKKHLERIYTIRLGRNPDVVLGGDRLLDDLRRYRGENVTLTVLELGGRVFGLFFDDRVTKLLSCLVGDDRRVLDPGAYDEPSHVDLTAEERKVLRSGC